MRLNATLLELADLARATGPVEARLEELERSRAGWEAMMEAELQKASSTYKAAANAESRARTMERHVEKFADPFAENGEPLEEGVPTEYAPVGEEEGVQPVRMDLATPNRKELALRMKYLS